MRLVPLRLALWLALCISPALPAVARADSFSPAQRSEIVHILRDALRSDPTILRDALASLQADEERGHAQMMSEAIERYGKQLIDPADAVEGNPFGDVTIVEFYDTRCPYCRRMLPTMTELLRAEPNVKLVLKDLPILGPVSQLESRALLAAQRQGGYVRMRDAVMQSGGASTRDTLRDQADQLGLDGGRLMRDIDDPAIKARLEGNVAMAQQIGVQGTPAMIIGKQVLAGAADLTELRQAVAKARSTR